MRARVFMPFVATLLLAASLAAAEPVASNPPVLDRHVATAKYGRVPGRIIHHGVKVTDYDQRKIPNCWFAAGAAAVAHRNPEIIHKAFARNPDGSVSVRLYVPGKRRSLKPVTVTLAPDVPLEDGEIIYGAGHNTRHGELWPSLLEKAAARLRGGYQRLAGGNPARAMEMITGKRARQIDVFPEDADEVYDAIKAASRAGHPMASLTYSEKDFAARMETLVKKSPEHPFVQALRRATGTTELEGSGVWPWHAYTILGVSEKGAKREIVVRNPWGYAGPPRTGFGTGPADRGGDGIFKLPIDMFAQIFTSVQISGTKALPKK